MKQIIDLLDTFKMRNKTNHFILTIFLVSVIACDIDSDNSSIEEIRENNISSSIFKRPFKKSFLKKVFHKINPKKDTILLTKSGSKIRINKGCLVDKKGEQVVNDFTLEIREFNDFLDVYLEGIPMNYTIEDEEYFLETAGMIELNAYDSSNQELYIMKDSSINLELASENADLDFNVFTLDTTSGEWTLRGNDSVIISEINENPNSDLVVPVKPLMENNDFSVDHLIYEDKSLLKYKGFRFRPVKPLPFSNQSFYSAEKITIDELGGNLYLFKINVKILRNNSTIENDEITLKFERTYNAEEFEEKLRQYNLELAEYKKNKRLVDEYLKKQQKIYRSFMINSFGIWNCDRPNLVPRGGIISEWNFKDSNNNDITFPLSITLIERGRALLFPFDVNNPISYNPNNESILFEVNNRFQLCYCKIDSTTNTSQLKFEIMNIDLDSENVAEQIKEVLYN